MAATGSEKKSEAKLPNSIQTNVLDGVKIG
jgi:hypothetical protein